MAGKNKCAACLEEINNRKFLTCSKCCDNYEIQCVNISEKRFYNTMTAEHKSMWVCPQCHSKKPKQDNSSTPIRQQPESAKCSSSEIHEIRSPLNNANVTERRKILRQVSNSENTTLNDSIPEGDTILSYPPEETENTMLEELRALRIQFITQNKKQEDRDHELVESIKAVQLGINSINNRYTILENEIKLIKYTTEQNAKSITNLERENKLLRQELNEAKIMITSVDHKIA